MLVNLTLLMNEMSVLSHATPKPREGWSLVTFLKWIEMSREKTGNASDLQLLQKTFDRMK